MKTYHKNPRTISEKQFADLETWLEELGDLGGIVHDLNSDEVIGGNQRARVFDILKAENAPVVLTDEFDPPTKQGTVALGYIQWRGERYGYRQVRWTARQCEKANVVANRAGGAWDWDVLANEFEMGDLLEWGFTEFDFQMAGVALEENEPPTDPGPQIDKAAELQEKWGVKLGQVWELGEHRVVCGDCTDKSVVEAVMRGERAQLCVTSPPYAVGKEYEEGISFVEHLALLRGFADRSMEVIIPGGFLFINFGEIAAQSHTKPLTGVDGQCLYPISKDYWQIFHEERGMALYAMRIWYKPFNRLQQPFWSYNTSIPHYQEWEHIWTWRLSGGGGDQCYDWDISSRAIWDTRNEATDDKPLTRHVAAFPVCLPERAIRAHSKTGAVIWEPFSGSGTVIVVCQQLGRFARAIEIEPKYIAVTLDRWHQMTGVEPVLVSG